MKRLPTSSEGNASSNTLYDTMQDRPYQRKRPQIKKPTKKQSQGKKEDALVFTSYNPYNRDIVVNKMFESRIY